MPRVAISGYYGFNNCGDEAMLHAMIMSLRSRMPSCEPVVFSKDPAATSAFHKVEAVPRDNLSSIWRAISRSDLLISGGGGLLQDVTGLPSLTYYLGLILLAKLQGKPVFFYGQGIGPVKTGLGRFLMKKIVNRVDFITVRDEDSRLELSRLGVDRPPVHVAADPALGIDVSGIDKEAGYKLLLPLGVERGKPVAGISVRSWQAKSRHLDAVARIADNLAGEGWQVVFVPMHYPHDLEPSRAVLAKMQKKAFLLSDYYSLFQILDVVSTFKFILGMRLHFLIFGALFNLPMAGIAYDPKINHFLKLVGLPLSPDVDHLTYAQLWEHVRLALSREDAVREKTAALLGDLKERAVMSAALVHDFLAARDVVGGGE